MFSEDLSLFFVDFFVDAVINGVPAKVLFDKGTFVDELNEARPSITIRTEFLKNAKFNDPVTIKGEFFTIARIDDDGTGISTVILNGKAQR